MLLSENKLFGFYGEFENTRHDVAAAWDLALEEIAQQSNTTAEGARLFLDSRLGRHFGYDVVSLLDAGRNLEDAIKTATSRWQAPKIGLCFGSRPAYSLHAQIEEMLAA